MPLLFLVCCHKEGILEEEQITRTVIVYMAADNDLSYDAYNDIEEMQNGYAEKGVNLIVFLDPADEAPHILQIENGSSTKVRVYPEFNSASVGQMNQVLMDVINLYPAGSYGLVLWSHGTSWLPSGRQLRSFGEDSGSQMNIMDLAAALPVHFDFILLDACLMGSVEVVYELKNKTDYILAPSTETIYSGFPYEQVIPCLIQKVPDLKKAAASYFNYYDRQQGDFRSATISLINTRELERLAAVTNQLISGSQFDAETFDRTSVQRLDVYTEQYHFDFLDFMVKAFPDADINPLKEQLDKTVLYKAHTPEFIGQYLISTYCGLSCYIPGYDDLDLFYQQLSWHSESGFYKLFNE